MNTLDNPSSQLLKCSDSKAQDESKQSEAVAPSHSSSRHRHHHRHHKRERSRSRSKHKSRHSSRHHSKHRSRHDSRHKSKHRSKHHSRQRSRHRDKSSSSSFKESPREVEATAKSNFDTSSNVPEGNTAVSKPVSLLQSKYERELYIGNLPPELTNNQLLELLNRALIRMKATTDPGNPIESVFIGAEGRYAFAIFRSVEETNMALALKGVTLMGYQIKVSKINMNARPNYNTPMLSTTVKTLSNMNNNKIGAPKTVGEITASTAGYKMTEKLQIGSIPKNMTEAMVEKLMKIFGKVQKVELIIDPITKVPNGQCYVEFSNEVELQSAASGAMGMKLGDSILETKKVPISQTAETFAIGTVIKAAAGQLSTNPESVDAFIGITPKSNSVLESHPSRVIKIKNLVNIAELPDNSYYEEIFEDIQEECKKCGNIIAVEIPKPNVLKSYTPGLGFVYVQFESVDSAMMAVKKLNGLMFLGRKVEVVYYPEDPFRKRMLDL